MLLHYSPLHSRPYMYMYIYTYFPIFFFFEPALSGEIGEPAATARLSVDERCRICTCRGARVGDKEEEEDKGGEVECGGEDLININEIVYIYIYIYIYIYMVCTEVAYAV